MKNVSQDFVAQHWSDIHQGNCNGGARMSQIVFSSLALITFLLCAALNALLYVDTNPLSTSPAAAVNGRQPFAMIIMKSILVAIVSVWPHAANKLGRVVIICVAATIWLTTSLVTMSYNHHRL